MYTPYLYLQICHKSECEGCYVELEHEEVHVIIDAREMTFGPLLVQLFHLLP